MDLIQYENEAIEQNIKLLDELSKLKKDSKIYRLNFIQLQTNIICMKTNRKLGMVLVGQDI